MDILSLIERGGGRVRGVIGYRKYFVFDPKI